MDQHMPLPLPPPPTQPPTAAARPPPPPLPPPAPPRRLSFLDLPQEVQKDIVAQCSQSDLICLSLVSKHFHDLTSAQLYRNFHIVFPDEDDPAYDSPIDGLAGGLETFVTSDYDYGKHLRDLSLDTLSAGDKAEKAYKPYLYSVSCGKFMNTLLHLTLRKARSLETFTWNIRVELSRQVYKTLHSIDTLKDVHIRMQAGPSLYETPPPLPLSSSTISSSPPPTHAATVDGPTPQLLPQQQAQLLGGGDGQPAPVYYTTNAAPMQTIPSQASQAPKLLRTAKAKKQSPVKEPPTLSGFKKLRSLAVLDMDTLDSVKEIQACVRNSSSTLTKLKLSLSHHLAAQARKPSADAEMEDSDQEDDFQVVPGHSQSQLPPHYGDSTLSLPARAFRAAEERKSQEAVLGRIFGVEPYPPRNPTSRLAYRDKPVVAAEEKDREPTVDAELTPAEVFVNSLKLASTKLQKNVNRSSGRRPDLTAAQQEVVDLIDAAARKYVAEMASQESKDPGQQQKAAESSDAAVAPPATAPITAEGSSAANFTTTTTTEAEPTLGSSQQISNRTLDAASKEPQPEDIDIEEPEGQLNLDGQETPALSAPSGSETPVDSTAQRGSEEQRTAEGVAPSSSSTTTDRREQNLKDAIGQWVDPEEQERCISDYIRSTRGLRLQRLSLYLIPVKASVLFKAIDIRVLQRITLLNVGPQQSIWTLFAKENKVQPLALRRIFTDNVSPAFLNFVSQLEELHELFILERDHKYKPESFAAKTTTTMEQIRRLVLRKHLPTLRRLMIKNMDTQDWDIDEHTMRLICRKGKLLRELAVSMNIRAIHTLMQNMGGLINLIALLIIRLRNEDTCIWVMRETKKFFLDSLSHNPQMKLEWLSIDDDDQLEKLVRIAQDSSKKGKKSRAKGKEPAAGGGMHGLGGVGHQSDTFPLLPVDVWDSADDSCSGDDESGDEDGEDGGTPRVRLETIDGVHFYDVWGIKIFKKEVVSGRL